MKTTFFILILFSSNFVNAHVPDIVEVRSLYEKSTKNIKYCEELIDILQPYNEENNPLLLGYRAGATALMAKFVFNPLSKINYFNNGVEMLEKAIHADRMNIELRYLRYTIQSSAPSFLGYNKMLTTDRSFLKENIQFLKDPQLRKNISAFLETTE